MGGAKVIARMHRIHARSIPFVYDRLVGRRRDSSDALGFVKPSDLKLLLKAAGQYVA